MMSNTIEEALVIELGHTKTKIIQLERTTKWWSESTAMWREKWGQVRNERDELRFKLNMVTGQNNALITEYDALKLKHQESSKLLEDLSRDKNVLDNQNKDNNINQTANVGSLTQSNIKENYKINDQQNSNSEQSKERVDLNSLTDGNKSSDSAICHSFDQKEDIINLPNSQSFDKLLNNVLKDIDSSLLSEPTNSSLNSTFNPDSLLNNSTEITYLEQLFNKLLNVDEQTTIDHQVASTALKHIKKLQKKTSFMDNFVSFETKQNSEINISSINSTLPSIHFPVSEERQVSGETDSSTATSFTCRKIDELRNEVEKLLAEKYKEWEKRERTENCLEETKRLLKSKEQHIKELEDELKKKSSDVMESRKYAMIIANDEIQQSNEEIKSLRTSLTKTKKILQDKTNELLHQRNRTEQLEVEMAKLRSRIEELKKQNYSEQEKVDLHDTHIRRLQRSIEEKQHQNSNLEIQIKHMTNRLKRQTTATLHRKDSN